MASKLYEVKPWAKVKKGEERVLFETESHLSEEVVSFDEVSSNVWKLIKGKWLGLSASFSSQSIQAFLSWKTQ